MLKYRLTYIKRGFYTNSEKRFFKIIMDDYKYIELAHIVFDRIESSNNEVDHKSFMMIGIIGVMLTIQTTIFSHMVFTSIIGYVKLALFLITLILFLASILYFISIVNVRRFSFYPNSKSLRWSYESGYDDESLCNGWLGDYLNAIDYNKEILSQKAIKIKKGFCYFQYGLIMSVAFIIINVLI